MGQDVGPAKGWPESGLIHCDKCGRAVDTYHIEWGTTVKEGRPYAKRVHTGEVIMTITCHGETWRASNKRGRLD
jgi:predicted oxidoreductase